METETDNEMEVARATEMDIEVDVENNSTKVKPKNDTLEHNVPAEEDVDLAMNSSGNEFMLAQLVKSQKYQLSKTK